MKRLLFLSIAGGCLLLAGCGNGASAPYPFLDASLTVEERASDIVSRLTLDEKISQMLNATPAVERLGIPAYDWWNECLHGVGRTEYKVTVYPQAIGMAAGWDTDAMRQMGDYTAEEARAVYNAAQAKQDFRIYHGLTFWTPNINIFRDPRWGRGQETYGEDPCLTGLLGKNFVEGLQGDTPGYLKAAGCAKHYAVHSGPEPSRHTYNATISNYDLWDTYLPAFRTLVDAGVAGVMCAYNAFEGQPCCGNDRLMVDILRNDWNFTGYVTSDCGAIDDFYKTHRTHPSAAAAAADAVIHGTDVDCGNEAYRGLKQAVEEGIIAESQIDVSLKRLFSIRIRLGMFDPKESVPFSQIDETSLEKEAHTVLALKMARQSIVLLKNDGTLPLKREKLKKIAVLGPNANDPEVQLGNYNGFPTRTVTPLDGLKDKLPGVEIMYEKACELTTLPDDAQAIAAKYSGADVLIFVGGISPRVEGEEMPVKIDGFYGGDRTSILLPEAQTAFLKALKATGKPVIFVMMTGSAIAMPYESAHVNAILNSWYGGQAAGQAIADVILGDCNPSGHLPLTFYAGDSDLPDFEDYDMSNRTYKYFKGKALYPFGYGLSYTTFGCQWRDRPGARYQAGETLQLSVDVKNEGAVNGEAVSQAYIKYPDGQAGLPLKELRAFARLRINAGETAQWAFSIPLSRLAKWDDASGALVVPKGKYTVFVGNHSEDEAVSASFMIE
ncbi:MAG: glycoside hydrolase family 3 C-terminal domain-containing protein [Tannerella sp.]|jgi:beta-glucosidase|nr:glycoside hydrolase family 3 C-terminal domain-containing protein [Tannerella sp.]